MGPFLIWLIKFFLIQNRFAALWVCIFFYYDINALKGLDQEMEFQYLNKKEQFY
jgi:hypothetical protein